MEIKCKEKDKVLAFILNEENELLLLKTSDKDKVFNYSFFYTVTGGKEEFDLSFEDTVKREIKEETNLDTINIKFLNYILKYNINEVCCNEHVFLARVKKDKIILNEEHVEYLWCKTIKEYVDKIKWFYNKEILLKILENAVEDKIYFKNIREEKLY